MTFDILAFQMYVLHFWHFSKTGKTRVSHRVKMMIRWPGDPDVNDDPNDTLTRWPNDPVPCLISIGWAVCMAHWGSYYAFHATHAMRAKTESVDKLTTETTHAIVPCNVTHGQQSTRQLAAWRVVSRDLRHSRRPQTPRLSQSLAFLTHSPYRWLLGIGSAGLRPMFAIITPALVGVRTASCLWDKRSRGTTLYEPYAVL